ncbi:MAG: sugar ABC transporter substrate-binding protein [Acidimicrobiaceae bacterium]|nr:sugar ABC transporter substrate-binding protein [Acidimicrobiaceae bacterium]MCY4281154.1 sugar ABC transporter substrate-binding protein [Acidimicrobiaceae bacterium]MCY4294379.1 sugar ABC transporter substrate-binding protein [Acidimicrobiaceae bacterium]
MKWIRLIALAAAFTVIAAACTDDDDDTSASDTATASTVAAVDDDDAAPEQSDQSDDDAGGADAGDTSSAGSGDDAMMPSGDLSLDGFTVGVAVVGTQHFWDREAFEGAKDEIERLGGSVVAVDGGRDNAVHADNHDTFLTQQVDAVVTILGDAAVEPKLEALKNAGIPVFGVDHASPHIVNNTGSDNFYAGSAAGRLMADAIGGEGQVVVFNAFSEALSFCGDRYETWKYVLDSAYPDVTIAEELAEEFANAPEDARQQTLDLLERYPEGQLHAIHVACWDQPAIGVYEALQEAGRTEIVVSAIDAGPDTLELMMEDGSPWLVNIAQQPRQIATVAVQNAARHLAGENLLPQSYVDVIPVNGPQQAANVYQQLGYGDAPDVAPAADSGMAVSDLSLDGFTVGVAVVGTQHFWDREAFEGAKDEIERLGGSVVAVDGGRDNAVHADNHDTFLTQQVDAVVTILGDAAVEPKLEALKNAGIPVFGVDHASPHIVNNTGSDNFYAGSAAGRLMADAIGGEGQVVVFNAFSEALSFCGDRYETWKYVLDSAYPDVTIAEELAEEFANAPEDARQQTLDLLERYPEGQLHAIHVACWDQPAIGVYEALQEAGRTEIVVSAIDAGPDTLELMMEDGSPWLVNIAQQPRQIATVAVQNAARHLAGENLLPQSYVDVIPVNGPQQAANVYEYLGY